MAGKVIRIAYLSDYLDDIRAHSMADEGGASAAEFEGESPEPNGLEDRADQLGRNDQKQSRLIEGALAILLGGACLALGFRLLSRSST